MTGGLLSISFQSGILQIKIILEICRNRIFWKAKIIPLSRSDKSAFSLFSENNGFLNIYMLK